MSNTIKFGFLNVCGGLSGLAADVTAEFGRLGVDEMILVDTQLRGTDTIPLLGVVAHSWGVHELRGQEVVSRGRDGVIVATMTNTADGVMLEQHPNGKWTVVRFGDMILISAYFNPTTTVATLADFDRMRDAVLRQHPTSAVVAIGDWNARLGNRFGDHRTCPAERRLWMEAWLDDPSWDRVEPVQGKWTTFNGEGRGITDWVLCNAAGMDRINNLIVHEDITVNSSDHRILTFTMDFRRQLLKPAFSRINVRKLCEPETTEAYQEHLENSKEDPERQIRTTTLDIGNAAGTHMSWEDRLDLADQLCNVVTTWILSSAEATAGRTHFRGGAIRAPILEPQLVQLKRWRDGLQTEFLLAPAASRRQKWDTFQHARRIVKGATKRAKRRLYYIEEDVRVNNPAGEATRVACMRRRADRSHCALNRNKMPEYRQHFCTTIGSAPTGTGPLDPATLQHSNPAQPLPILSREEAKVFMPMGNVQALLQQSPRGKATGDDGIFGEMLALGHAQLAFAVGLFFESLYMLRATPRSWNRANVAHIWKKKGDKEDVRQYRPISLISRLRMVFENMLRPHLERTVESFVDVAQGGFRRHRSTMDQILTLNEIIVRHPDMQVAYLDIQAAYDECHRDLVWQDLDNKAAAEHQGLLRRGLLPLLRSLFDHCTAFLLVLGAKSAAIEVLRGFLQGTVCAPLLFTVAINDLPGRLRTAGGNTSVRIGPYWINSLLFADDTSVFARTTAILQQLLDICTAWATERGQRFSVPKCVIVAVTQNIIVSMNGIRLPQLELVWYLGMIMRNTGVDMIGSLHKRIKDATRLLQFLKQRGFNSSGMRALTCVRLYPIFIRSIMEYGLALQPLSLEMLKPAITLQKTALCTMFTVPRTTANASLHIISSIVSVPQRNRMLNASYLYRLHQSNDRRYLAAIVYRNFVEGAARPARSLLTHSTRNPLWMDARTLPRKAFVTNPLIFVDPHCPYGKAPNSPFPVGDEVLEKWHRADLLLQQAASTVKTSKLLSIPNPANRVRHPIIQEGSKNLNRRDCRLITLWLLGNVAKHKPCFTCNAPLTRQHALDCSGVVPSLAGLDSPPQFNLQISAAERQLGWTIMDKAIAHLPFLDPADTRMVCVNRALQTIRRACLGKNDLHDATETDADYEISLLAGDQGLPNAAERIIRQYHSGADYQRSHLQAPQNG